MAMLIHSFAIDALKLIANAKTNMKILAKQLMKCLSLLVVPVMETIRFAPLLENWNWINLDSLEPPGWIEYL